jgi:heme-degrading monooxygenase HmoA
MPEGGIRKYFQSSTKPNPLRSGDGKPRVSTGNLASAFGIFCLFVTHEKGKEKPIMFARLTIVQVKPDKVDDVIKIYGDHVVPSAKGQKGYKGIFMLTDRKTGKGISITMWESEQDAVANEKSGYYQQQVGRFKDYFTKPPVQEGYEVSLQG